MTYEKLAILRDAAVVLLALEALVLLVLALLAGWYSVRGLRWLQRRLPGWLGVAHEKVQAANGVTRRAMGAVASPLVRVEGAAAGLRAGLGAARRAIWPRRKW